VLFGLFWAGVDSVDLFAHRLVPSASPCSPRTTPPPGSAGGLANAIFGSLLMSAARPLIGTHRHLAGTYVAELRPARLARPVTRFIKNLLSRLIFVYAVYVANVQHFSGWPHLPPGADRHPRVLRPRKTCCGWCPTPARAGAALGAPQWIVISFRDPARRGAGSSPASWLAIARTAARPRRLFTALNNQFCPSAWTRPMANLPVVIFQFAMSPYRTGRRSPWRPLLITLTVLTPEYSRARRIVQKSSNTDASTRTE